MSKYSLGLAEEGFKMGDIEADGGTSTAFTTPGEVHENTLKVTPNAPTTNNFFAEGYPDPAISVSRRGLKDFACDLLTFDNEVVADLTGGSTDVDGAYHEPAGMVTVEKSVQITDMQGTVFTYPRVSITADVVVEATTTTPNVVRIVGVVQKPTKAGLSSFSFVKPAVAP